MIARSEPRPLLAAPVPRALPDLLNLQRRREEIDLKVDSLRALMRERGLGAIALGAAHNFAWITAGASSRIVLTSPAGPATALVRSDGARYLITSTNEAPRLMDEEALGALGWQLAVHRWYEDSASPGNRHLQMIADLSGGRTAAGADLPTGAARPIESDLQRLRLKLTDGEIDRYRWLGRHTAKAVDEVARRVAPGMSERTIAAQMTGALLLQGITATVLLVATDDRTSRFRHATTTDRALERYVLINLCAERWGLVAAISRLVHFGPVPDEIDRRLRAAALVDAAYIAATTPGATAHDVLEAGRRAFDAASFPDEWREHHQGGAIGYLEREWIAYPGLDTTIQARHGCAWNPTVQGTKVEDTILVFPDFNENLTAIDGWPTVSAAARGTDYERPGILVRG